MTILLVEDSAILSREMQRQLASLPGVAKVVVASAVREAEEMLARRSFDVWVLDFELGDGTALDLLARRGDAPAGRVPVVLVATILASPRLRRRCREAGARQCFAKPDEWERLLDTVRSLAADHVCTSRAS